MEVGIRTQTEEGRKKPTRFALTDLTRTSQVEVPEIGIDCFLVHVPKGVQFQSRRGWAFDTDGICQKKPRFMTYAHAISQNEPGQMRVTL